MNVKTPLGVPRADNSVAAICRDRWQLDRTQQTGKFGTREREEMESDLRSGGSLKNGNHFLALLKAETTRLNTLVSTAEQDLGSDDAVPEEVRGSIRVAVGKARMLLKKKFLQFEELCFKNLGFESEVRYTVTSEDLAGYWDTIVIEVLQVYQIFDEIDILRKNNWKEKNMASVDQPRERKMATKINEDNIIMGKAV